MNKKRIVPIVIASVMAGNMIMPIAVSAQTINTNKEEVIYANLDGNGELDGLYAVNIFNDSNIVDYGEYSSIKNMTTEDKLSYINGQVTGKNTSQKLYYEGVLKDTKIPWNISIKYYLDGQEISADKLAGKNGSLEIKLNITKNEECNETFFNNYALQTSLSLNTDKCSNIEADGATVANVGKNKQLSYIVLPGKGADISIKADVKDFEMDSIAINGVKLNLNVDVNTDELTDKIKELTEAIEKINSGAASLNEGTGNLTDGASRLDNGINTLSTGADTLNSGIIEVQKALETLNDKSSSLTSGSTQVSDALNKISESLNDVNVSSENISALTSASSDVQKGIDSLVLGIGELQSNVNYSSYKNIMTANGADIDSLQSGNASAIAELESQITSLTQGRDALLSSGLTASDAQVITIENQISQFKQILTLLKGNSAVIGGTETYINSASSGISKVLSGAQNLQSKYAEFDLAISNLSSTLNGLVYNMSTLSNAINTLTSQYTSLNDGIYSYTDGVNSLVNGYSKIVDGASNLVNGTADLKDGSNNLVSGVSKLSDGTSSLQNGTTELNNKTSNLNTEVDEKINDMTKNLTGNSDEVISFVSDKNTNVESVQFVIKTKAVQKSETEIHEEEEKELTIWERFINLFK